METMTLWMGIALVFALLLAYFQRRGKKKARLALANEERAHAKTVRELANARDQLHDAQIDRERWQLRAERAEGEVQRARLARQEQAPLGPPVYVPPRPDMPGYAPRMGLAGAGNSEVHHYHHDSGPGLGRMIGSGIGMMRGGQEPASKLHGPDTDLRDLKGGDRAERADNGWDSPAAAARVAPVGRAEREEGWNANPDKADKPERAEWDEPTRADKDEAGWNNQPDEPVKAADKAGEWDSPAVAERNSPAEDRGWNSAAAEREPERPSRADSWEAPAREPEPVMAAAREEESSGWNSSAGDDTLSSPDTSSSDTSSGSDS